MSLGLLLTHSPSTCLQIEFAQRLDSLPSTPSSSGGNLHQWSTSETKTSTKTYLQTSSWLAGVKIHDVCPVSKTMLSFVKAETKPEDSCDKGNSKSNTCFVTTKALDHTGLLSVLAGLGSKQVRTVHNRGEMKLLKRRCIFRNRDLFQA